MSKIKNGVCCGLWWLAWGCGGPPEPQVTGPSEPAPPSAPVCGNGVVEADGPSGEACDEGEANADDGACTSACQLNVCGDGLPWAGVEGCDEGEANDDTDACTSSCEPARCGDGLLWDGVEACDEGKANADNGACTAACQPNVCGDGLLWDGVEDCDEGADNGYDGTCTTACRINRPSLDLSLKNADARLVGYQLDESAGQSASIAGDVNGDGFDDFFIGAGHGDKGGGNAGAAYLVYGPVVGNFSLQQADAELIGEAMWDYAGKYVSMAGDVDGDGFDDLLVGAYGNSQGGADAGAAYLIYGPVVGSSSLQQADAKLIGEAAGDWAGGSVSAAGDVNGDGFGDLLVGAYRNGEGGYVAGAAYLVHGPIVGHLSLRDADAKLIGEAASDAAGFSVSAGDVNGDGFADVLVGAIENDAGGADTGAAYLVHGPVVGHVSLSDADATLTGEAMDDLAGKSVSAVGDVDGDGLADLLVGAAGNDEGSDGAGAAYLVHGPAGDTSLSNADAKLIGEEESEHAGGSVSAAGDVDGDGFADVLVGAHLYNDGSVKGAAYLMYGPVVGTVPLASAHVRFRGQGNDYAGGSVSAGDTDGDGFADVLIGAYGSNAGGFNAGAAYLVLGSSL